MKICFIPKLEVCTFYLNVQNIILEPSRVKNNEVSNLYNQTTDPTGCENTMVSQHLSDIGCENIIAVLESLEQNDKNKKK